MKIYCLRDRLLDYMLPAFLMPGDKEALAAISNTINHGEQNSALAQSPQHFEVWRLGEILETGKIKESQELLADASGLVRERFRKAGTTRSHPGDGAGAEPPQSG